MWWLSFLSARTLAFLSLASVVVYVVVRALMEWHEIANEKWDSVGPIGRARVAVVGAGPSGLVTAKELVEEGHDVTLFEKSDRVGGVFAHYYKTGKLTSSTLTTPYSSFCDGECRPVFWSFGEYVSYLKRFATHFGLYDVIEFDSEVVEINRVGPKELRVTIRKTYSSGETSEKVESFNHVAICLGIAQHVMMPSLAETAKTVFGGKIMHSSEYVDSTPFAGRRVVIIGLGESGSDISLEIARSADELVISSRRGPGYVIPRYFEDMHPQDMDTTRVHHAIPRKFQLSWPISIKSWLFEKFYVHDEKEKALLKVCDEMNKKRGLPSVARFGTKNMSFVKAMVEHGAMYKPGVDHVTENGIVFVDGSHFDCDTIVCATGFSVGFQEMLKPHPKVAAESWDARKLWKHCYNIDFGSDICWIGYCRPGLGSIPPISEMAARYFAMVVSGRKKIPSREEMMKQIVSDHERDAEFFPLDFERIRVLVDFKTSMDDFAILINAFPKLYYLFVFHFHVWFKIVFGPLNTLQYRANGYKSFPMDELTSRMKRLPSMHWSLHVCELVAHVHALLYETMCVIVDALAKRSIQALF